MNNKISKKLLEYRSQIDKIDSQIIDLLKERMKIVKRVGKHKEEIKDRFFIRSNREADMIKDLVKKMDDSIPKSVIVSIWRKIITSANILEQDIKIALHNPSKSHNYYNIVKEYYGDFIEVADYSISTNLIAEIEKNNVQLGIFVIPTHNELKPNSDHWWINIANNQNGLKVFAKIPFIESEENKNLTQNQLVVVAIKEAEKSEHDKTLLTIELNSQISDDNLLKSLKTVNFKDAKIIKNVVIKEAGGINFYLVEIDGFYEQDDIEIKLLQKDKIKPHVKVIGNYPTPIRL